MKEVKPPFKAEASVTWIKVPIQDILGSMIFESCRVFFCGTIQCKDFYSSGFCIKETGPPT